MTERLARYGLICLIVLPLWVLLRRPWKRPFAREAALCAFVLLTAALLVMALEGAWAAPHQMLADAKERIASGRGVRLTPFSTLRQQWNALPDEEALVQLLGNTLLFLPWGFFLPLLWRRFRGALRLMGMALLLTVCIETTQLFIGRTVDVDDLILNFIGSMTGSGLWWMLHRLVPSTDKLTLEFTM